jgi:hypothetical protein
MAIIPGSAKVLNQYENVNTTYGGSKAMKAQSRWYTMDDVIETINAEGGSGVTEIIAGDGISVDEGTGVVTITNTVEPYVAPYTVFTALIKQEGDTPNTGNKTGGDDLFLGVTYYISDNGAGVDLTVFGAPNNDAGTYFICTTAGSLPLTIGTLLLTYGTITPTATILENTIGNIYFEYTGEGIYSIKSDNLFTLDKTFINGTSLAINSVFNQLVVVGDGTNPGFRGYFFNQDTAEAVILNTLKAAADFTDDMINNPICIEIRVYN